MNNNLTLLENTKARSGNFKFLPQIGGLENRGIRQAYQYALKSTGGVEINEIKLWNLMRQRSEHRNNLSSQRFAEIAGASLYYERNEDFNNVFKFRQSLPITPLTLQAYCTNGLLSIPEFVKGFFNGQKFAIIGEYVYVPLKNNFGDNKKYLIKINPESGQYERIDFAMFLNTTTFDINPSKTQLFSVGDFSPIIRNRKIIDSGYTNARAEA